MPRYLLLALPLLLAACSGPRPMAPDTGPLEPEVFRWSGPRPIIPDAGPPEAVIRAGHLADDLRYLASDALMGRRTGTPGADSAAAFLARAFAELGLEALPGAPGYRQPVPFWTIEQPTDVRLSIGDAVREDKGIITLSGRATELEARAVWIGDGAAEEDYANAAGHVVIARTGAPESRSPLGGYQLSSEKRRMAAEAGAVALIELYALQAPWAGIRNYLDRARITAADPGGLAHVWVEDAGGALAEALERGGASRAGLRTSGLRATFTPSVNVAGVVRGTDPAVADEYVVAMAHYDHIGAGRGRGPGYTPEDSIYNGARDNGMGTVALLGAARSLAARPARRPVLLLAVTAEEEGLLGSRYYVEHPLVPLEKTIFALNTDGAGYNDTTIVSVVGLERTTADPLLRAAAAAFGLGLGGDPAPEQDLFNRSDNANFARAGVPSPNLSPGVTSFEAVAPYYHMPADEADESFDFAYLHRYAQVYARAVRLLADAAERPTWVEGDPYAPAGAALYAPAE